MPDVNEGFKGFYRPDSEALDNLIAQGTIVLDTNVLLNLYRYPQTAQKDLFSVLGKIKQRLFIPYQVMLEFQRNRLSVLAEQISKFEEVRKVVSEYRSGLMSDVERLQLAKRHALIDPSSFVKAIEEASSKFEKELESLRKRQQNLQEEDPVRKQIDGLIGENVGPRPKDQKWLDDLYVQGALRYATCTPPGFADLTEKDKLTSYTFDGLKYEPAYGDLIVWMQILHEVKTRHPKGLLLITDDEKADWWWSLKSQGRKRLGPDPSLVQELNAVSPETVFYMYNSEQFLKYASRVYSFKVEQESIDQVRNIRLQFDVRPSEHERNQAIISWLMLRYGYHTIEQRGDFPDLLCRDAMGEITGYEVRWFSNLTKKDIPKMLANLGDKAEGLIGLDRISSFSTIIVVNVEQLQDLVERISTFQRAGRLTFPVMVGSIVPETRRTAGLSCEFQLHTIFDATAS